ncbi:hypothetical protein LAZ67_20000412 [Cordylochernes scorpioides]|uniref:Uncharacterized protein n=1 Tax=Cordylochernes scorpioides TaxID=51811 RepID=A0ABY6LND8_9ARAC|nr:hypothetical protein LAZ67_20000412 [Cordylochernes scorpioides]
MTLNRVPPEEKGVAPKKEEMDISTSKAYFILTGDLAMKRVAAKFVPKLLTAEQNQLRVQSSKDMLDCTNSDHEFMNIIITGGEC